MKAVSFGTEDDTLGKLLETYEFLVKVVLMKDERKLPRALSVVDGALEVYPNVVILRALRANVLTRMDRLSEALEELSVAARSTSVAPMVHFNYGLVYAQQGHAKKAADSFRSAIRGRPGYYEAVMELGRLYYWSGSAHKAEGENM